MRQPRNRPRVRRATLAAMSAAMIALTAGCSSYNASHNHNAPTAKDDPNSNRVWHFFDSPGSFQTIIYTCVGTEGYYETQDNSYPIVIVPQDPRCGFKGVVTLRPIH